MTTTPVIFLIDDDPEPIMWMNKAIERYPSSFILRTAQNYVDATELLFSTGARGEYSLPQIILLEITLSNYKGITLLESIKNHPDLKKIPLLILSNSSKDEDIRKCHDLHVNAYIHKPNSSKRYAQLFNTILRLWMEIVSLPEIRGVDIK